MALQLLARSQYILRVIFNFVSATIEWLAPERLLLNFTEFNNISSFNDSYCLKGLMCFCHADFARRILDAIFINM